VKKILEKDYKNYDFEVVRGHPRILHKKFKMNEEPNEKSELT